MTSLGKSLVFYLKYPAEMLHLYERAEYQDNNPILKNLEDTDRIREMARAVGAEADRQAAEFLTGCGTKIADHFVTLGNVRIAKQVKHRKILKKWTWYAVLEVPPVRGRWFKCVVQIDRQKGVAVPWLWRKGGRAWVERVQDILGNRVLSARGGSIVLPTVPLLPGDLSGFEVDRDPLVERVLQTFAVLGPAEIEAVSRGVGEVDQQEHSDSDSAPA